LRRRRRRRRQWGKSETLFVSRGGEKRPVGGAEGQRGLLHLVSSASDDRYGRRTPADIIMFWEMKKNRGRHRKVVKKILARKSEDW
jgi:hypothetical protein